VGSQRLTAWAMTRPHIDINIYCTNWKK
jgi:hypothetical protein